jgi:hypothetical protein
MRVRTLLTSCATALLIVGLSPAAASAGTGSSTDCSDGSGGTETVIDDTLVTVAVETDPNYVALCYSTAGAGTPGQVTGGKIEASYFANVLSPTSAKAVARCSQDYQFGIAPVCLAYAIVNIDPSTVTVTPYPGYVCVLYIGSVCQAYAPGATVDSTATNPLVEVDTFGVYLPVFGPSNCVALFVTPCP